jgi:hypothetical protein
MHSRIYRSALLTLIAALAVVGTANAATLGKPAARHAAVAKVNSFLAKHHWADSGKVGKCQRRSQGRVNCRLTLSGASRTCSTQARVMRGKDKAKARLGKLACKMTPAVLSKTLRLSAHLSAPKRDPLHPFSVAYGFGATASPQTSTQTQGFATEEFTPLPEGVLAFYSDGVLECALNVGGLVDEGECPIDYAELGIHRVTTIYTSGSESAAATEVHNIEPIPTTTTLEVSYEPLPATLSNFGCGDTSACHQELGWRENGDFDIGTLSVTATVSPWGTVPISVCTSADSECVDLTLDADGKATFPVSAIANFVSLEEKDLAVGETLAIEPEAVKNVSFVGLSQRPAADIESGKVHFHVASGSRRGYAPSEATTAIRFQPEVSSPVERVACGC